MKRNWPNAFGRPAKTFVEFKLFLDFKKIPGWLR